MTCDEFRRLNGGELTDMSRGERAACCVHYWGCSSCKEWIRDKDGEQYKDMPAEQVAVRRRKNRRMAREDEDDPEFRSVLDEGLEG